MAARSRASAECLQNDDRFSPKRTIRFDFAGASVRPVGTHKHSGRVAKRLTGLEYARFLNIAEASLAETEYLLMVSRDLGYITHFMADKSFTEISELSRMLHGHRKQVEAAVASARSGAKIH